MKQKLISVVVTCFNEEKNILEMYTRVAATFDKLKKYDFELIFVDNNSEDDSEKVFERLAKRDRRVKAIFMSRNFGSPQPSFIAGLEHSRGDAAVLLHGDIQDPPEMIPKFIQKWERGFNVAYGIRKTRKGYGIAMNFFYKAFYFLLNRFAYVKIPLDAGEFSLIDRRVVDELLKLEEYDYLLRCLRAFVGFKQVGVKYTRDARHHGRSTENFLSGLWWAKTIIVNFSFKPLAWISNIAFLVMIFSFILLIINLTLFFFVPTPPRGIPTIVILILFIGGIQLLALSIIAEYLAKIFLEVKRRPRYIIRKKLNI